MHITLIGMPGAGKSTVGKLLAEKLNYRFVDIDKILEEQQHKSIQVLLNEGEDTFLRLEEAAVLALDNNGDTVVAPGGSIVYSKRAMNFLKNRGKVIYLDVSVNEIKRRIAVEGRGIVGGKEKTLEEIYMERSELYKKYADLTIESLSPKMTIELIVLSLV